MRHLHALEVTLHPMAIELHNKHERQSATWALWAEECCYMMETWNDRKTPIISQPTCFVNVIVMKITHTRTHTHNYFTAIIQINLCY